MTFRGQNFAKRFEKLGDQAEEQFESWATNQGYAFARWGFKRPPLKHFSKLPSYLRIAPDYILERKKDHSFVEVKGVGRDQTIKIKEVCFDKLRRWQDDLPVEFFVYDSNTQHIATEVSFRWLDSIRETLAVDYFYDGGQPKKFYKLPTSLLSWSEVEKGEAA